tara:strand:+ start:15748 stop:18309 length:2562 start_codon:yes stop_codon:yes gene_type:complete
MTINLADNNPRNEYTVADGNSQTVFTMDFEIFDNADLNVYVDNQIQTLTTHYKISDSNTDADAGHTSGTDGHVHFTSAITASGADKKIVLTRDIDLQRTTDFPASGAFQINSLNTELDKIIAIAADIDDSIDRSLRLNDSDVDVAMTLPLQAARKGTVLGFNATTGVPEAGPTIADVSSLAAITADIAALADIEDGTVATDAISGVAGIKANVTTVAGIGSSNIAAVAGKATEIGRLGTADAVSDMNTLGTADIVSDMNTLADIAADITTLAHIEDGTDATDAIQTVVTNISAVQGAAANAIAAEAARDSAKAISAAMGAALDNFDDRYLGTMADSGSAPSNVTPTITTTNGSADITVSSASGISIGMKVTSANIPAGTNVIGISGTTISLNNSATAAASGTSSTFSAHGVFGTFNSSTDGPSTDNDGDALVSGALYFNTTDNEMRVYDGGNWIAASAAGSASMNIFEYTATGGQTSFSGTDDNSATLSYTANNLIVMMNGAVLDPDEFTATNGTAVVLDSGAAANDEIVIFAFKSFTVADTVSKSSGGTFTGAVTFDAGANFGDNDKAQFGAGNDLQIFHDGSNSRIKDEGTGSLLIGASFLAISKADGSEDAAKFFMDGAVELYHDNTKRFETSSTGVSITGALDVTTSTHANASVFKSTGNTQIMLQDTDATANDQFWGLQVSGGDFNILTCDDDRASGFVTPLTIDSSGRITKPTQPAFMAQPSSTQSNLAGDTNVDVLMGTEQYDVGSNFSSSTFTAPVTGKYFLSFTLYGNQLAGSANYMEMSIDTSNRNYTIIQEPSGTESVYAGGTVAVIADMDANDTAKCRVTVGGSSTFDVTTSSRFTGALIC